MSTAPAVLNVFLRRLTALFLIAAAVGAFMAAAWAQPLLAVPTLTARVIDQTGTLNAGERQALESKLAEFEQRKGTQIAVLMVPATAPEDIAAYANRVANAWRIGRRDVGDGLLIIVAKDERRMRIEVAKTLEGAVPDIAAARIIDQQMKPAFRNGDFAGGIDAALDQLFARISGEALPEPEMTQEWEHARGGGLMDDLGELGIFAVVLIVVFGQLLRALLGGKIAALLVGGVSGGLLYLLTASLLVAAGGGLIAAVFILLAKAGGGGGSGYSSGGGWSSGSSGGGGWSSGSSSSSGGGFSSGGGGDFGGGGASGDW